MIESQMLQLHVWDLRTQVEAQLRRLTGVQQLLDAMTQSADYRDVHKQRISQNLSEIQHANATIADVSAAALDIARSL